MPSSLLQSHSTCPPGAPPSCSLCLPSDFTFLASSIISSYPTSVICFRSSHPAPVFPLASVLIGCLFLPWQALQDLFQLWRELLSLLHPELSPHLLPCHCWVPLYQMRNLVPVVFLGAVLEESLLSCSLFPSLSREQKPKITEGFSFHAGFPVCQPGAGGITCVYASSSSEQEQMGELAETTAITSLCCHFGELSSAWVNLAKISY